MTADEVAEIAMLTPRTVRRYVRARLVTPRRVPMEMGGYRMDFNEDDVDTVLRLKASKRQRLERQSPALARYQQRRAGRGGVTRATGVVTREAGRAPQQRCPRCRWKLAGRI